MGSVKSLVGVRSVLGELTAFSAQLMRAGRPVQGGFGGLGRSSFIDDVDAFSMTRTRYVYECGVEGVRVRISRYLEQRVSTYAALGAHYIQGV